MTTLYDLWRSIGVQGKGTERFARLARRKLRGRGNCRVWSKYDVENFEDTGGISYEDAEFLRDVVEKWKPGVIFEVGTWFGTSAGVMAFAQWLGEVKPCVYTCDVNDLFVVDAEGIEFFNTSSTLMFRELWRRGVTPDFLFVDGQMSDGDWKKVRKAFRGKPLFVGTHDKEEGKGRRVVELFCRDARAGYEVMVNPGSSIWIGREKGEV